MNVLLYFLVLYCMGGISASITYHRILAHRLATLHPLCRKIMIVLALPAGTPVQWVGTHRQHHQFTDRPGDPHSPNLDEFWYAHCGWYIQSKNSVICMLYAMSGVFRMYIDGYNRARSNQEFNHKANDIAVDPFCSWISKKNVYQWHMWSYASLLLLAGVGCFGISGILITWASMALVYNLGDSINSFSHHKGSFNHHSKHYARNLRFMSWVTFGEGWHRGHHDHPSQVNYGYADPGYIFMRLLECLGLLHFTLTTKQTKNFKKH